MGAVVSQAHTNKVGVNALQGQAACQRLVEKACVFAGKVAGLLFGD